LIMDRSSREIDKPGRMGCPGTVDFQGGGLAVKAPCTCS
jgi:hypothetical protein